MYHLRRLIWMDVLLCSRCLMSQNNKWVYCSTYLTPCCLLLFTNFILFILVIKASLKPKYEMKSFVIGVSQIKVSFITTISITLAIKI